MELAYEFFTSPARIHAGDVQSLDRLLAQLTTPPRRLTVQDIEALGGKADLLLVRDVDTGRLVGTCCLVSYTTLVRRHGRVEDVVVDAEYRGRGIARKMVEMLLDKARDNGVDKVELTSNPSRREANALYASIGFERVETNVYRFRLK